MTTTTSASQDHSDAIGRVERHRKMITADRAAALAATLDLDTAPAEGDALPPGWHWLYFNSFVRRRDISHDGHPKRGGFLPAVKLPRRMWAGGRLTYHDYLIIGREAEKVSEIVDVKAKSGRAGQLVFVTVRHSLSQAGKLLIVEDQDIVYREASAPGAPKPSPAPVPEPAARSQEVVPDPVLLFRYSALTSNGHRIHYDKPYATGEEGYPNLVVHGPLIATLLQGFAQKCRPDETLTAFDFRGMAPLFVDRPFHLEAKRAEDAAQLDVWARGPDGELAMSAVATFRG